jgi:hypothetical protein
MSTFDIQAVGRLIEDKQTRMTSHSSCQAYAFTLASGQPFDATFQKMRELELIDKIADLASGQTIGETIRSKMATHCLRGWQARSLESKADVPVDVWHRQRAISGERNGAISGAQSTLENAHGGGLTCSVRAEKP